ncbi:MAG: multidrug efflux RND transporter permease subunit [Nitrospirota bacterium]|nr:multidrug efflux RND transporter permease subunit [Nitrospirota bacterium]MDP2384365.1 multidrug efflux RND transporter permease subunit [Nitrospirota bacterium]MDP3596870.1 multidrug efflux RND transporter permease subunit [Nitrospirota bacterium]
MTSHVFIDRPILASVVSIIIVVMGLLALQFLPVAQFPEITPPVVQIDADYPGASAEVAAESVARPIEVTLPGIDNLLYFDSTSSNDGHVTIKLTFEIGTDPDIAQVQTQNREKLAEPQLPAEVIRQGVSVKKVSPDLVAVIVLKSTDPRHDAIFLSNYATLRLVDDLKRVNGIGDAVVFGQQNYSMRIILNPLHMAKLGLMPNDIAAIIREQNRDYPSGTIGREPAPKGTELTIPIITKGRLTDVKDFEELIVRALPDGSLVRLKDVARIELGAQSYALEGRWNSTPTTFILTFLAPGANALDTIRRTRAQMDELAKNFPSGVSYDVPYDTTRFIEVSITEVIKTLAEAMVLVVLVVYMFLQSWRATIIPTVAVPVSLIGTFIGLYALGFSINTITLFGMVLAIGIVVDDAIVVVENVERHMRESRLSAKEAAKRAMSEVTSPIIAIVLVLVAVFVPVGFVGGITGALYKQFAATIAISVTVSGFVALTLSPALCAMVLVPQHEPRGGFWAIFDRTFGRTQRGYSRIVASFLARPVLVMLAFGVLLVISTGLFKGLPKSFLPEEDQGYFIVVAQLPDGASKQRTDAVLERVERYFQSNPAVHSTDALSGQNFVFGTRGPNSATMFVPLVLWDERPEPQNHAKALVGAAFGEFAKIPEAMLLAFNAPAIRGVGAVGGFSAQLQDPSSGDFKKFAAVAQQFVERAQKEPAIGRVGTNFRVSSPRLYVNVNRERAKALGIPISDIFDTLQAYFGNFYINDFIKFGRVYHVQTEAEAEYRATPQDISKIYVRAQTAQGINMISLDTVVTTEFQSGPDPVNHFNGYNTALVLGAAAPGFSSGQALEALDRVGKEVLVPQGYAIDYSNISFQERRVGGQSGVVFAVGLLMVFLVLAAQFESWVVPFAVILAVPFAIFGALIAVWIRGFENDVYFQIGLVTLIGLSAKNAILIVEFANTRYEAGQPLIEAALEAAKLRFRPIIMTSMAFIFGMVPLVIARGAGASSRQSIGTGVMGGMLAATVLAILFIPLFYVVTRRLTQRRVASESVSEGPPMPPSQEEQA